jgi:hypothetical protein
MYPARKRSQSRSGDLVEARSLVAPVEQSAVDVDIQKPIGGTMQAWTDKSETIDALAAALVKATGEMTDVARKRTANAGSYSYSYADLGDALGMARPVLSANGLAVLQTAEANHDEVVVHTTILHESGQYVAFAPTRLPAGKTAQATGSAITYARRYSLMAALGLATEDDDGATASPRPERVHRVAAKPAGPRTEAEGEIRGMLAGLDKAQAARVRGQFKAEFGCGLAELDTGRHDEALDWVMGIVSEIDHEASLG